MHKCILPDMNLNYSFYAKIWLYSGQGSWHFASLPKDIGLEVREIAGSAVNGFGSLRVNVILDNSVWRTSVFPDKKSGSYILPIKKSIRDENKLIDGSEAKFTITFLDLA